MLAGDVLIHHNHDITKMEDKDPDKFRKTLEMGRRNFNGKYHGVDAWDDVEYVFPFIQDALGSPSDRKNVSILGIDTRAGQPILDIKNTIRKYGIYEPVVSAFTQDPKYYTDLMTFCSGHVENGGIDTLLNAFISEKFDYIIFGEDINGYSDYLGVVRRAYSMLKKSGQLFVPLKNIFNVYSLFRILGYNLNVTLKALPVNLDQFLAELKDLGINKTEVLVSLHCRINEQMNDILKALVSALSPSPEAMAGIVNDLMTDRYWIKIVK